MLTGRFEPINHPIVGLGEALDRPGAEQVQHLRALMESRPYFSRIPGQDLLESPAGEKGQHVQATRDAGGSYAFVYFPLSRPVEIHLDRLVGRHVQASWFDPRSGADSPHGEFPARGTHTFTPPAAGPDWVLVLDAVM
jgi:YD repeat-containing protein